MKIKSGKSRKKKKTIKIVADPNSNLAIPLSFLLFNKYLNQINFVDFIDRNVTWDPSQWKVSPGNLAKAFILSTIKEVRAPLSRVEETFVGMDTETLFGKGVIPDYLNDDAIAQSLDRISQSNPESLFCSFALAVYTAFNILINRLHADTTSLSFFGEYEVCENDDDSDKKGLKIEHGYNKDHLPQCKQVVVGKIVNEHGIALVNSTMDGSTSDVDWNQKALKLLQETFSDYLGQAIYIADSKLINLPTLKILYDPKHPIRFISRCPDNFYKKLAPRMIEQAYKDDDWLEIGQISERKDASFYSTKEYTVEVAGHKLRVIVVKTSAGEERAARAVVKQRELIEEGIEILWKKTFVCEADALEEWQRFQKEFHKNIHQCHMALEKEETIKRPRGNPGKNPKPPEITTSWKVAVTIEGPDPEQLKKLQHSKDCFVVISNVSADELDQEQILREYKEQHVVEVQFHLLKQPALASAIFLKTPSRIDALVMLLNISLLIRALIQYKLRKSIQEIKEELPKIGPNGSKLKNPTFNYLIKELGTTALVRETPGQYYYRLHDAKRTIRAKTYFRLLGVDMENPF